MNWTVLSVSNLLLPAQQAIAQCVQDARNFAKNLSGPERKEIMDLTDDVERLSKKLADLKRQGKVNGTCNS